MIGKGVAIERAFQWTLGVVKWGEMDSVARG
jgi:hypothetical protein